MKRLVLFTASFPYPKARETSFLVPEAEEYRRHFDEVTIVPLNTEGEPVPLPSGIAVDRGLAWYFRRCRRSPRHLLRIGLRFAWPVLRETRAAAPVRALPACLRDALQSRFLSRVVTEWLHHPGNRLAATPALFYAYWADGIAVGVAECAAAAGRHAFVCRAHGYDLYEERRPGNRIPDRQRLFRAAQRVFPVSEDGARYLARRFPEFAPKFAAARLGTLDPGVENPPSADGVFRVLSCAYAAPVKRVDLAARILLALAQRHTDSRFRWEHIGDGPTLAAAERLVRRPPPNLQCVFRGNIEHAEVMATYARQPVDLFLNTSSSEAMGVALMEAASYGVPLAGPAVGGVPEVVTPANGVLFPVDAPPDQAAGIVAELLFLPEKRRACRRESRRLWEARFDGRRNARDFVSELPRLAPGTPRE